MQRIKFKNSCYWIVWLSILSIMLASNAHTMMVDLTYPFDEHTIYWPTEKGFQLQPVYDGETSAGYFYSAYKFCAPEHGGTHVDAPRHFARRGLTVDKIPLDALQGTVVVISVASQVRSERNYAVNIRDVYQFERQYRKIRADDIVLFYTGWGQYWGNKKLYLGTNKINDVKHLHFPGISKEVAQYLVSKGVKAVGLDTPSLDPGTSLRFWAHRMILGANIYGIENLANLQKLPPLGARLIVAPMKIQGGSGAPARVYAMLSSTKVRQ